MLFRELAALVLSLLAGLPIIMASSVGAQQRDYDAAQLTHDAASLRSFHGGPTRIRRSFRSDTEARGVLRQVLAAAGLAGMEDRIFLRASAETANAEALLEDGQRLVFYNVDYLQGVREQTSNYWSMVAILAHEVGHHVRLHTVIPGRNHDFELEADYQAGFILRRMGATREQAVAAYRTFPEAESPTHPGRAQRVQSVTLGWVDGGGAHGPPAVEGGAPGKAPVSGAPAPGTDASQSGKGAGASPPPKPPAAAEPAKTPPVTPVVQPSPVAPIAPAPPAPSVADPAFAEAVQRELQRLGCYKGVIDGDWGSGSRAGFADFLRLGKLPPAATPNAAHLETSRKLSAPICPPCNADEKLVGGECVSEVKAPPVGSGQISRPSRPPPAPPQQQQPRVSCGQWRACAATMHQTPGILATCGLRPAGC